MLVYFGGEDQVTKAVARRLVRHCAPKGTEIEFADANIRDYGTKSLSNIDRMIRLAEKHPVVCVFDLDGRCVVDFLKRHASRGWKRGRFAINLAVDEAESWLIADREGFADFFQVELDSIPPGGVEQEEIADYLPYKTSLFILHSIVPFSKNKRLRKLLRQKDPRKKPSTYNTAWLAFVQQWDIENARKNSKSLNRAIERIGTVLAAGAPDSGVKSKMREASGIVQQSEAVKTFNVRE